MSSSSISLGKIKRILASIFVSKPTVLKIDLLSGTPNNELVDKYVAAGDPPRDGKCTKDEYAYDSAVKPEYYYDQPLSKFNDYKYDIARFNKLISAIKNYASNPAANKGFYELYISKGLHRIWGESRVTEPNGGLAVTGDEVFFTELSSVSFDASPRGNTWSRATLQIDTSSNPLPQDVVAGMMYFSGELLSENSDISASSSTAIVNDDVTFMNSGHIIREISADRMSFKVDVPHVLTNTTRLVGGNFKKTGASKTGFPISRISIPLTQIAFTGGFDGRQDEAWLRPSEGFPISYKDLAFVDNTDPEITRENGYQPDRKNFFSSNATDVYLKQNVGFCGAEGHVLRVAKLVRLTANLSAFGGAGLNTRARFAAYAQITSFADFTRCSFGGSLTTTLLGAGFTTITAQNCVILGSSIGANVTTGSDLNIQSSLVYGSNVGFNAVYDSKVFTDTRTVFENCIITGKLLDTSKHVKIGGEPIVINCGPVSMADVDPLILTEDLYIDKVNPRVILEHGSTITKISSEVGQVHVDVDSGARDIHFNVLDKNTGVRTKIFRFDMGTKDLFIDNEKVIGTIGAPIPNATIGTEIATINAILETMRNRKPSIGQ